MTAPNLPAIPPPQASYPAPSSATEPSESAISPAQIGTILWAYRKVSLMIAAGVMLVTVLAVLVWPRTYESTATLMVNFDVYDPLAGREFPMGLLGSYMVTQVELARGADVMQGVIDRLDLDSRKPYVAGYDGEPAGLLTWVETVLRKQLLIDQGRYGSQLIYVTYSAASADEAAEVANAVADVYTDQQSARQSIPASERAERYTLQLAELKDKVSDAQNAATGFRRDRQDMDADSTGDVSLELLTALEHRLQEAQNLRRNAQARASGNAAMGADVLGSTMIQSLKSQLAQQNSQMAELLGSLGRRHPQVLALQSQINVTRQALAAEQQAYSGNADEELRAARQLEMQLQDAVEAQRIKVSNVQQMQDEGAEFQLALTSAQSVYSRALEGYDQVLFASSGGYTNVNVVGRAVPPPRPTSPKVTLMLLMGAVAGLGLGLLLPLVYELINRRVRCPDDLERDHGIPVLAELGPIRHARTRYALPHVQ